MNIEVYRSKKKRKQQWYWRMLARNGRILDASSQGFSSKQACLNNFERVRVAFKRLSFAYQPEEVE